MIRTYTNSPQCVPGRTTFISGLRTDQTKTFSNNMGFAAASNGTLDEQCITAYNSSTCRKWANLQKLNYTLIDALTSIGYNIYLYGKMDTGANIIEQKVYKNASAAGFHGGPGLATLTRSTNIWKVVRQNPLDITNDSTVNVQKYSRDWKVANGCSERLEWLKSKGTKKEPWFVYCSHHTPHPPFDTNDTFLRHVAVNDIPIPEWIPEQDMHVYDHYMSLNKNVYGKFNYSDINKVRKTYYAMNVEIDQVIGSIIHTSYQLGYNESNTIYVYTSDHGEMNMEHRQIWKNSMYEASSRIPLFFVGPNIKKNVMYKNITQIIDILPTLIDFGGGDIPSFLAGYSLKPYLYGESGGKHPNYMISQYHSNMGNTASYMVRKDKYKYVQFGHYLNAFNNRTLYRAQLFDLENDPNEVNDIALNSSNENILKEMENVLISDVNYEYIDCVAKQNDFEIFEEYFWNVYNETELYKQLSKVYDGFNESDWQTLVEWR
eukprot:113537_1